MNTEQKITALLYMTGGLIVLSLIAIFMLLGKDNDDKGRYVCKDISWSSLTYTVFDTQTGNFEIRPIKQKNFKQ